MDFKKFTEDNNRLLCPICHERGFVKGEIGVRIGYSAYGNRLEIRFLHFHCWYNSEEFSSYMPSTKDISMAKRVKFMREV